MNFSEKSKRDSEFSIEIDWLNVLKLLWKKAWLIVLLCATFATCAYAYTKIFVKPQYSSSVVLYVNNKSYSGADGIDPSDLSVAQSLVKTYIAILMTEDTIVSLQESLNFDVSVGELKGMISAAAVAETEIFRVTVTTDEPEKAQIIANSIINVLGVRINDIIDGSSMEVVNFATFNPNPVSPNAMKNAMFGALLGFTLACVIIFIIAMLDDVIHSEDYVVETYNLPVLAKIPDLAFDEHSGGYKKYSKSSYRYYRNSSSYSKR